ncbi:MAG: hypothetical protein PHX43_02605, partial [Alphaproteobacteria bacterium]|nr:hypothetical protein [Alphaproteobacteria bacterium]
MSDTISLTQPVVNNPAAIAQEAVTRRNFARSAETLAKANTAGFKEYLAETNQVETKSSSNTSHMNYEDSNFSVGDVLDVLNPIQHIPLVGTLYRYVTGDNNLKPYAQVTGDILYGGLIGGVLTTAVSSIANAIIAQETGTAADQQIASAIFGPADAPPSDKPEAAPA